jgi:hypothetical protein
VSLTFFRGMKLDFVNVIKSTTNDDSLDLIKCYLTGIDDPFLSNCLIVASRNDVGGQ